MLRVILAICGFLLVLLTAQHAWGCVAVNELQDTTGGSCTDSSCSSSCITGSGGGHLIPKAL